MDSGNSGSLQSSSGGDDEYDSRAAATAFVSGARISNPPLPQQPFFDPLSNYLQLHHNGNNPNPSTIDPNPNTSSAWPRIRSDANQIPHDIIVNSSSSAAALFMPTFHPSPPPPSAAPAPAAAVAVRNPKKRSRTSRRAPTTVLTTDTTNFRAMVQEFTGIPAPPFDSSSVHRTRLDLFGASRPAAYDSPTPPYLLRPFAQKVQPPIPSSSASTSNPVNTYQGSPTNLFYNNPFLANFLSPKFPFSDPKPGPFQLPPPNEHPQFGNHLFSPLRTERNEEGGGGYEKQPENNVHGGGGGEGMVESWICSSE